jgi:PAS domain S-box-containing protein
MKKLIQHKIQTEGLQSAIFNSANFSSIATDAKGVIQIFNVGAERMLGYAAADVMNKITPADISDPQELIARAKALSVEFGTPIAPGFEALMFKASRGIEDIYELTYIRKDGSRFPAVVSVTALRDAQNAIIGYLLIGTDNTARKQAEETLRLNEESLAVTLHSIGDAVLATDSEGRVTRLNGVAEKLTGWTEAEALGRPAAEVFHIINEETRQPAVIPVDKVLATGEIHGLANHTIIIARDGTERPIADSAAPIRDKDGKVFGVVLVFRDMSEERRTAAVIDRNVRALADFKAALDEHAIVAITDAQGKITYANDKFCAISKYAREELIGQDHRLLNSGHHPKALMREMWETVTSGRIWHGEVKNRAKDGSCHWLDTTIVPFFGADGKPAQFITIRTDITGQKRAEEEIRRFNQELEELVAQRTGALRESEEKFRCLFDSSKDAFMTLAPPDWRFTSGNPSTVAMFRARDEAEFTSKAPWELSSERQPDGRPSAEKAKAMIEQAMREGNHFFEWTHKRLDGEEFPATVLLTRLELQGRLLLNACVHDITERKQIERQMLRSQRLESIGTLAGGVAHDLNNALAPILMSVELLRMDYPKESEIMETIETSAKRGADMVRQLLTFAKGAEGERVPLRPDRLVKELEKMMQGSFPKNLQLAVKCDPQLPLVLGDATQLHQVLLNLCVNARDAMPHGGTLTLEAERMEMDATYASSIPAAKPGNYVVLRVRDTGTGIPPEIIDRIFDPFFSTKSPDKGTGLGLSTVMGIVKGHGGFLQVYSEPGHGSTFAAYLPAEDAGSDTEHVTKAAVAFYGQGETILFVDDERALREVTSAVLRRLNFEPLTAIDGADGLIQASQHRTELSAIITDMHMPHMDGLAFVRTLRRLLPDIPIIVASGRMEDAMAEEFKTLGVTSRLDKPFTEVQLAEALKTVFKK